MDCFGFFFCAFLVAFFFLLEIGLSESCDCLSFSSYKGAGISIDVVISMQFRLLKALLVKDDWFVVSFFTSIRAHAVTVRPSVDIQLLPSHGGGRCSSALWKRINASWQCVINERSLFCVLV